MKREEITLEIDAFTPSTLPMSRLAEYLKEFSALLGHEANVHFSKLAKGSARCQAWVEGPSVPKVRERVEALLTGGAPKSAAKAHAALDDLLAKDNAIGSVLLGKHRLIEFPGRRRGEQERIGPVLRDSSIDGEVFLMGGRDHTINVHLRDGDKTFRCEVSIELARRLAPYFLNGSVRLLGQGNWMRIDGRWEMMNFVASDFVALDNKSLFESVEDVRRIFAEVAPIGLLTEMDELRHG